MPWLHGEGLGLEQCVGSSFVVTCRGDELLQVRMAKGRSYPTGRMVRMS